LALAESIRGRRKVYLDLRYWLRLRDIASGVLTDPDWQALLDLLRKSVGDGKLLCPIAESTFMELAKQNDPATRAATARVIDELSFGVTLLPVDMRTATEIAHFIHSATEVDLHPVADLVWSKLSYVLGFLYPSLSNIDPQTEFEIQKLFFNKMWTLGLSDIIDTVVDTPDETADAFAELAKNLNEQNRIHAAELKSFEGTYKIEVQGVASHCAPIMADVIADMTRKAGHSAPLHGSQRWDDSVRMSEKFFRAVFTKHEARMALRTMHIQACLHAHIRWNKNRLFEANDFYDFNHAAAALGYCDAFFTERSLADLANRSNMALTKINGCRVTHRVDEAIQILLELTRGT